MTAVVGDIGLYITRLDPMNMATYPEEQNRLLKTKKILKQKKMVLVAKIGNGGKRRGTGIVINFLPMNVPLCNHNDVGKSREHIILTQ